MNSTIRSVILAACCLLLNAATIPVDFNGSQASARPNENTNNGDRSRRLAVGDFARFNQLFDNAKISIPGTFEISERVGIVTLDMTMRNIICYDISIGDAAISHIRNSNQDIDVSVNVTQLDIKCDLSYEYDYGLLRGTGEAVVTTDNNSMSTKLGFASSNFELVPPSNSEVESCVTNIQITNIEFTGDFVSNIVEIFERFIRNTIETEIEKVACEELSSLGTSFITDMLGLAGDTLQQYEGDLGPSVTDPLHLEQTTEFPSSLVALDLLDTENTIGTWFNQALQEVDKLLTAVVPDPNGPTGTGQDLGINKMLRDNLLDENRALVVDVEQLPIDGVLFEGHDKLTETTITLQQVKLLGLDTMTLFNPLDRIGQYTLQTDMTWQQLTLQFDVSVDIKPSTKEDSMLQDATSEGIIETISIELGLENVNVSASLFLVVDQDALGAMKIGPLLKTDYIMPCLLSALHSVQLSGLHIDPQMVSVPTLAGFVSPGLDRIITDAAEAVFEMYKGALEDALPNIFQTSIREFVNREVFEGFLSDTEIFACPPVQEVDGYVDFRDLFFSPSEALAQGGAGNEPYGDLAYTAMGFLRDDLLALDGNGSLKLNSFLIEPLTKAQSGTIGTLQFPKDLISLTKTTFANKFIRSFVNRFEIGLSNLRLKNLDILVPPVSILQTTTSPHVLTNQLTMGPIDGHPLEITVGFKLLLEGENTSPLEMVNDVDISMSFGSAAFVGDILAKIDADKFLQFPLKDILLPQCWLATIPAPTLDDSGVRLASSDLTLAFQQVALTLSSLGMNVEFVNTTNLGTAAMTDILSKFSTSEGNGLLVERMNTFVQEILENDWLQTLLDRGLVNAPISCPHSSEFDESASPSTFPQITFPDLSNLTVDTMFYAAALIAESSFVVYMESERLKARESTNALAGQDTVSDLEPLIDWTNLDGRIGAIVDSAIQEVTRYLAAPQDESGKLGVNIMIQDWLLDSNSFLSWEFDDLSFDLPGIKISLTSVNISGLDSFTEFATWQPIAPQTILTNFTLDKIDVNLSVDVVDITTNEKRQGLTIGLSIANVSADVATFIAMSKDRLEMLELGSFMNIQNIIPCLLSSVDTIEITKIDLSIGELENPRIDGLMEESQASLDTFMTDVMEDYKAQILSTIPIIFDHTIRELLNGLAATYLSSGPCPLMAPPSDSAFIDFESFFDEGSNMYGNLPPLLKNLLDSELIALNNRTGQPKINEILIAPFTERQSGKEGSLLFSGDLFSGGTRVQVGGLDANVQLRASDARIENLDTVGSPLEILVPVLKKKHMLNNSASLGIEDRPLRFGARLLLSLMGDENLQLRNDLNINLDLSGATVNLMAMLKIAVSRFFEFPLRDLFNLDCWLATIPAPELDKQGLRRIDVEPTAMLAEFVASIAALNLNISCVECSSPRMVELIDLLATRDAQDIATETANRVIEYFQKLMSGNFLQIQIDRALTDASKRCPHSPNYKPDFVSATYDKLVITDSNDSTSFLILLGSVVLVLFAVLGLAVLAVRWLVRRRHRKWLLTVSQEQVSNIARKQEETRAKEAQLNAATHAMYASPEIPGFVRWSMPLIIIGNIGFFLSGHLSLGATVNIEAEFAGEKIVVEKFFEFSMASSTVDIWNAGGHELAILILIFSGIWPYTKQLITLVLWFLPPTLCSTSRRGSILLWLDCLAKWSIIDIFVLVISIAAFRVSIVSPDVAFLPKNFYSINLLVVPLWGLYANMIAQLISQISSHFIIHYHRKIVHEWENRKINAVEDNGFNDNDSEDGLDTILSDDNISGTGSGCIADILHQHHFGRPHRGQEEKLAIRGWVNKSLIASAIGLVVFVILGCTLPSLSLNILGIVGLAVESGQGFEDANTQHNIFTVVQLLFDEARFLGTFGDWIGLGTLSILLIFTVLIAPLVLCAVLLRQWFVASTGIQRARIAIVIETLQAWQYSEVYLIAIFVASWQLGPISEYMINSYCNSLDETFAQWVYFGIIKAEDAQCFSVQSSIEEGSFILAVGAVLLAFLNAFVNKAATQYFRDMEKSIPLVAGVHKSGDLAATDMVVVEESIRPVPVLFTDTFRWFLRGVESGFSSDSSDLETSFHKYTTRTSGIDNEPNMHTMSDSTNSEGPGEMQTCWVMDHDDASESGDNSSLQGSKSQISMET